MADVIPVSLQDAVPVPIIYSYAMPNVPTNATVPLNPSSATRLGKGSTVKSEIKSLPKLVNHHTAASIGAFKKSLKNKKQKWSDEECDNIPPFIAELTASNPKELAEKMNEAILLNPQALHHGKELLTLCVTPCIFFRPFAMWLTYCS